MHDEAIYSANAWLILHGPVYENVIINSSYFYEFGLV